ncbi:MAG: hypothetical protein R6W78_11870, partial [Bacteroidales bacterium]
MQSLPERNRGGLSLPEIVGGQRPHEIQITASEPGNLLTEAGRHIGLDLDGGGSHGVLPVGGFGRRGH